MTQTAPTEQVAPIDDTIRAKAEAVMASMTERGACIVAFSGGVDSALVARLAIEAIGPWNPEAKTGALAVLNDSETLARHEVTQARETADAIGIPLITIEHSEFNEPEFSKNDGTRCFHCKHGLSQQLVAKATELGLDAHQVAFGINTSDLGDYRPGIAATEQQGTWRPLVDAGLSKPEVRAVAKDRELSVWNKPATPCLSSRVAYGTPITPDVLRQVEAAENVLRELAFGVFRVRHHGDLARVEVAEEEIRAALRFKDDIVTGLKAAGYTYVTLDMVPFRSGSMNEALPKDARVATTIAPPTS